MLRKTSLSSQTALSALQLGRIVGSPLPLKAPYTPIFKTQESEALSFFRSTSDSLFLVDLNAELRELLAQRLLSPLRASHSAVQRHQDHHVVRKSAYWTLVDLLLRVVSTALSIRLLIR